MAKIDQRDALEVLTWARLIELAQGFELDVSSRSNEDELIDVLARSKRASYEAILGGLGRDELKEIRRAAGVSDKTDAVVGHNGHHPVRYSVALAHEMSYIRVA